MPSDRATAVLEHSLAEFERASEDASLAGEAKAMVGLGAYDSIATVARKWHRKADRGDKERMSDFAKLDGWHRRWLAAAKRVDHPALSSGVAEVSAAVSAGVRR